MSRVYEALIQSGQKDVFEPELVVVDDGWQQPIHDPLSLPEASSAEVISALKTPELTLIKQEVSDTSVTLAWDNIQAFQASAEPEARLVALKDASELGSEKFRLLRARLRHLNSQAPVKTVTVTSAVPEDGKSLVSLNLAISLARSGSDKVLAIEGDLHKPVFADRVGLEEHSGLTEWFRNGDDIESHMYKMKETMLWLLPAGLPSSQPLELLQTSAFLDLLKKFQSVFDWIVVDAPPLLPLADVSFWNQNSDGLLLVVREGKTPGRLLRKGLETLDSARILGVVMNDSHPIERNYYNRYYAPYFKNQKA